MENPEKFSKEEIKDGLNLWVKKAKENPNDFADRESLNEYSDVDIDFLIKCIQQSKSNKNEKEN